MLAEILRGYVVFKEKTGTVYAPSWIRVCPGKYSIILDPVEKIGDWVSRIVNQEGKIVWRNDGHQTLWHAADEANRRAKALYALSITPDLPFDQNMGQGEPERPCSFRGSGPGGYGRQVG